MYIQECVHDSHLLEVSYCLVVSSLLLYQLKVDVIQPVLFILLIWTSLFKLHVGVSTCRYACGHWWEMKGSENCFDSLQPNLPFPSPAWCHRESVPPVWERVPCFCLSSWPCWGRRRRQWTNPESSKLVHPSNHQPALQARDHPYVPQPQSQATLQEEKWPGNFHVFECFLLPPESWTTVASQSHQGPTTTCLSFSSMPVQ